MDIFFLNSLLFRTYRSSKLTQEDLSVNAVTEFSSNHKLMSNVVACAEKTMTIAVEQAFTELKTFEEINFFFLNSDLKLCIWLN